MSTRRTPPRRTVGIIRGWLCRVQRRTRRARLSGRKKSPRPRMRLRAFSDESRQRPTLPRTCARSTIGGGRLNFRVRNGNGCDPAPMTTGKGNNSVSGVRQGGTQLAAASHRPVDRPELSFRSPTGTSSRVSVPPWKTCRRLVNPHVKERRQLNTLQTVDLPDPHHASRRKRYGQASRRISTS